MSEMVGDKHQHCYHLSHGPMWILVLQKCCKCGATRIIHADHAAEGR